MSNTIENLDYNPETGLFKWKDTGKDATLDCSKGYRRLSIKGETIAAHRVAWFMTHGKWPSLTIDHINGIKTDNRIVNLRDVSYRVQNTNQNKHRNGKLPGISFEAPKGKTPFWRARITKNRRNISLGCFKTKEEAHQAYLTARCQLLERFEKKG